jgi:predicted MFS family arabinose efflux permease
MVVASCVATGVLSALMLMATFGTAVTIALMPIVGMVGAFPQVGLTALLASETRAGAGTTMTLNQSLNNAGAAIGAALGGLLLATGGFDGVAYGVLGFGLLSALVVVPRPPEDAELRPVAVA